MCYQSAILDTYLKSTINLQSLAVKVAFSFQDISELFKRHLTAYKHICSLVHEPELEGSGRSIW